MNDIENLKTELAKSEARLTDITDSLAKGGPGSGPHKGGGSGKIGSQPSSEHLARAHTHEDAAAFHQKQSELLREAQTNLKAAGHDSQARAIGIHASANDRARSAHEIAAQDHYSASWGGSREFPAASTNTANAASEDAAAMRAQSNNS